MKAILTSWMFTYHQKNCMGKLGFKIASNPHMITWAGCRGTRCRVRSWTNGGQKPINLDRITAKI